MKAGAPNVAKQLVDEGNASMRLGRYAEALAKYQSALKFVPDHPGILNNCAVVLEKLNRLEEALASYEKVRRAMPNHPGILNNCGVVLQKLGQLDAALGMFDLALSLKSDYVEALNNRGNVLLKLLRPASALKSYDRALALRPDHPETLSNRASSLELLRRYDEAIADLARVVALSPSKEARERLLRARMSACDWTDFDKLSAEIVERVARGEPADEPISFTWHSLSPALQLRYTEDYIARHYRRQPLAGAAPASHERIRLAYLSSDFREHPISYLLVHLFEQHDRNRFEVIALSFGPDDKSEMRARLEKAFDRFIDVRAQSDLEIAQLIRREGIDILVDLVGTTAGNRAQVLAYRPAPLQVNFQGFPMGASLIDYTFSDAETAPDGLREIAFREKVVRLPDTWVTTDTAQAISERTPARAEEGLPAEGFVFCCFNTAYKITPPVFDAWMRLLAAVDGSILWLRYENDGAQDNLIGAARQRGVTSERLIFARRVGLAEHLARHRLADLFIDTFPYGAHTTAGHALWAGLPVLTQRGETFVSRVSASNVAAAGLPELVVDSLADYEAMALALARDPARLGALRERLARLRSTAPLFDNKRHCRHVEQAYLQMMERHRRGEPPASFDVEAID